MTFVTKLWLTNLTDEEIARIITRPPESVERIRRTDVDDVAVVVALSHRISGAM